jgi:hypothetical protein
MECISVIFASLVFDMAGRRVMLCYDMQATIVAISARFTDDEAYSLLLFSARVVLNRS